MKAAAWGRDLLDLFVPAGCVACGTWIPEGRSLVCALCRARLREGSWPRCLRCHHPRGTGRVEAPQCLECRSWPEPLAAARFAYLLAPPADDLVHALKYEGWRELADFMGRAVARAVGSTPEETVVVPVPTTEARLAERGYNQAAEIARTVAASLGLDIVDALDRPGAVGSQTSLAPEARRANVRGAFRCTRRAHEVAARPVLLVDDVLTTGATAGEAAIALTAAGAGPVTLVTFARALARAPGRVL